MNSERTILELIGLIYDATGDASRWQPFLEKFGRVVNAPANNIFVQDLHSHGFNLSADDGMDASYERTYADYYKAKNVYLIRGNHLLRTGKIYPSQVLCPDAVALRSEFYNDWIAPQRQRHGMLGVIYRNGSLASMIGAIRHRGARPFGEEEVSLLEILMPHLQRAVTLRRRIVDLEKQKIAATDALDHWSLGVILLDSRGRVLLMNSRAEEIVRQKDGLTMAADGLHAALPGETSALRRLIHDAIATHDGKGGESGGALALPRPSLKRSLNVLVTPLFSHNQLAVQKRATVALFLSDPEATEEADDDALRRFFGLSRAEAHVAALLIQGKEVKQVSEELHVSLATTRTHLRSIFDKTGTRRQAELVQLILRSPVSLRLHPQLTFSVTQSKAS